MYLQRVFFTVYVYFPDKFIRYCPILVIPSVLSFGYLIILNRYNVVMKINFTPSFQTWPTNIKLFIRWDLNKFHAWHLPTSDLTPSEREIARLSCFYMVYPLKFNLFHSIRKLSEFFKNFHFQKHLFKIADNKQEL